MIFLKVAINLETKYTTPDPLTTRYPNKSKIAKGKQIEQNNKSAIAKETTNFVAAWMRNVWLFKSAMIVYKLPEVPTTQKLLSMINRM